MPALWTSLALICALSGGTARAQDAASGESAEEPARVLLVVAVDDRESKVLVAPVISVPSAGLEAQPMHDEGLYTGDVPGDGIWMLSAGIPVASSAVVKLIDSKGVLDEVEVALPADGTAFFAYKTRPDGSLVFDPGARPVEGVGELADADGALVIQAAPVEGEPAADLELGADEVLVRVVLDDRAQERMQAPRVAVSQEGVEPVLLTDDGSVSGDTIADGIYMGELVVQRTQYLTFTVLEGDTSMAELTVFLPSTDQAAISLRTTEGEPGVELAAEPAATGGAEAPGNGPSAGGGGGGGVGADRLSHVLWAGVALFAIAFAYVRTVVWRAWRDELQPVVRKLDRWLDSQLPADDPQDRDQA